MQVECQAQTVSRLRDDGRHDGTLRPAVRVHVQPLRAGDAAEIGVVRRLNARLSDLVARHVAELRVASELRRRDLADVAEQLRRERVVRVLADVRAAYDHAGELVLVLREVRDHGVARCVPDDHRRDEVAAAAFDRRRDLVQRRPRHAREPAQLRVALVVDLRQVVRPELHRLSRVVEHNHAAVPVEDRPARGEDPQRAVRVGLRLVDVLRSCEHLQRPETEEERCKDDEHDDAQHGDAQREPLRDAVGLGDGPGGRHGPAPRALALGGRASQAAELPLRGRTGRAAAAAGARARTPAR